MSSCYYLFLKVFVGPWSILWGHLCPLFWTSDDSAHEFQSQGGSVITCALLLLACNNPQSHLWLPGLGIEPRSLTPAASTIPLCQPDPAILLLSCLLVMWDPVLILLSYKMHNLVLLHIVRLPLPLLVTLTLIGKKRFVSAL